MAASVEARISLITQSVRSLSTSSSEYSWSESRLNSEDLNSTPCHALPETRDKQSVGFVPEEGRNFFAPKSNISVSVPDDRYAVSNGSGYAVLICWDEYAVLDRELDTQYPMELDTPYSIVDQNSVWKSVEYGVSNELDTAYWGFLGVGTTFDIFQNIILIPYLEYDVLSPLDTAYWSLFLCGLLVSAGTDMPYLFYGYGVLVFRTMQADENHEYPSLISSFYDTHTHEGVWAQESARLQYEEMIKLRDLGANTPTEVPYTEEQILPLIIKGKQRDHILGRGRQVARRGKTQIFGTQPRDRLGCGRARGGSGSGGGADDHEGGDEDVRGDDDEDCCAAAVILAADDMLSGKVFPKLTLIDMVNTFLDDMSWGKRFSTVSSSIPASYYRAIGESWRKEHVLEHKRRSSRKSTESDISTPYHSRQMRPSLLQEMDNPDITMKEYVQHETEKALRNNRVYNRETAKYGKINYIGDINYLRFFKTKFPAIIYDDALKLELDFSFEPTLSSQHVDEVNWKKETSLSEYEDEKYYVMSKRKALKK
ncbi:hypothetical protein Tco_0086865 [Tanacetum coccineum]